MTEKRDPKDVHARRPNEEPETEQEVDEVLQEEMRRRFAERDDEELPDSTDRETRAGPGSGQGMGPQETATEPDRPNERGEPREKDTEWPG